MTAVLEQTRPVGTDRAGVRGRWAVTAIFFLNGLTLSTYLVRVPSLKVDHHLSTGQLGLVSTVFGAAALVTMQFVGALVARYGSALLIRLTLVPALLSLLGDGSWTIPAWLDRALPNITIEPPEERRPDRPPVTTGEPVPVAD